jgi:hypothetical protein
MHAVEDYRVCWIAGARGQLNCRLQVSDPQFESIALQATEHGIASRRFDAGGLSALPLHNKAPRTATDENDGSSAWGSLYLRLIIKSRGNLLRVATQSSAGHGTPSPTCPLRLVWSL